jgi:hypothetical protein
LFMEDTPMGKFVRSLGVRVGWLPFVALLAWPAPAAAQMAPTTQITATPLYTVALTIGPAEPMVSMGDAMMGHSGEVMVNGQTTGMGAPMSMATTSMMSPAADQGMGVNHHLEFHITRNSNGAVVSDVTPIVRVTDKLSASSRDLPEVMGMMDSGMTMADFHYGQNVWLPDGTYTLQIMLGPDTAVFRDVAIMGGAPMMMMAGS